MTDEQIIEALATKVMGWVHEAGPNGDWYDNKDFVGSAPPTEYYDWNPLTDHDDSKQLREKLAERFAYSLSYIHSLQGRGYFRFRLMDSATTTLHETEADTEERAVAKAALLAFGVKPTPSPQ